MTIPPIELWKFFSAVIIRSLNLARMPDDTVTLQLMKSEALVLFELLSRFSNEQSLSIQDQAEERVLWNFCADRERLLVEQFEANYLEKLDEARNEVRVKG